MRGERLVLVSQAAQVNDSFNPRLACSSGEILRGLPVFLLELAGRTHGMDQIIRCVYSSHARHKRTTIQTICPNNFCRWSNFWSKKIRASRDTANGPTRVLKRFEEPS